MRPEDDSKICRIFTNVPSLKKMIFFNQGMLLLRSNHFLIHKCSLPKLWMSVSASIKRHVNSSERSPLGNSASSAKPSMSL